MLNSFATKYVNVPNFNRNKSKKILKRANHCGYNRRLNYKIARFILNTKYFILPNRYPIIFILGIL